MNDKKFESLRKKLDKIGFPQTLHPDSFQLVDKLYNQLFKCMTDLDQQRKKKIQSNQTHSDTSILYDRIDSLTLQRDTLRKQLDEAKSGAPQKESDDRIRNLTMMVNNFRIKQEESTLQYEREVKKLSSEVAALQVRNTQLQKENQQLRNNSAQNSSHFQRQAGELASLVQKKTRQIRELEDSNGKLRIRVQVLEKSVEDSKFSNRQYKQQGKNQSQRLQTILKQELTDSQTRCRQLKSQLQNSREQTQSLKRQLRRSREQLTALRKEENSNRSLESVGRVGRQKIEQMYEETRELLAQRGQELRNLRQKKDEEQAQRGRLEVKLKQFSNKIKFLSDKNTDLQTEIQHISGKSTLHIKRVRQLQATVNSLQKQLKQNHNNGDGSDDTLRELRDEKTKSEQLRREAVIKDRQLKLYQQQLRVLKEQGEQRAIERDRAQIQLKKLQSIMAQGGRNLQALQLQKQELMKENRQLRTGKQMLTSADSNTKSQLFLLKERLQAAEAEIDELHALLNGERVHAKELESQIMRATATLNNSQSKNKQIFEDNRLMAGQIRVLEDRKNQLHEKVKEMQQRAHLQLEGNSASRRDMEQLIAKNEELVSQLSRKDQALRRIDNEKDELQNQLDRQTEQKARLKDQLIAVERDIRQHSRGIQESQHGISELQRKLSRSETARQDLQRQYQRLVEEEAELRDRLNAAEVQLRELRNQASLLVISNQEGQKEVQRSRNRIAQLDRKLKDRIRQSEEQRERASAMNILSNELQGEVQRERAEGVRLRGFVGQLQDANNHMYQQLEQKDQDIEELGRALEESQRREEQYIHEVNSYQRQLQNLTQDLQIAQQDARRMSGERDGLRAQRNWKKQVSSLTQDWRTQQEERFVVVQQDYQRCKAECEQLRHRCRQLQNMLSQQRVKNCRLSQQIGTPGRVALVQSRVESYIQNQNFNNSNVYARSRNQSLQHVPDNISQDSESESVQSAKLSLLEIQRKYMQTLMPNNVRATSKPIP